MNFRPSKQMVRNLVGSIRDELNYIGELFHAKLNSFKWSKV
jgi:hypothetical protein